MTITPVEHDATEALSLLKTVALPVADIDDKVQLFALKENGQVFGTIGIEHDGTTALLRSLSVDEKQRGKGYGDSMVKFLESMARENGIKFIYLLTTTAASFFAAKGYIVINRNETPEFIQNTTEFSSACPASATTMKKELG